MKKTQKLLSCLLVLTLLLGMTSMFSLGTSAAVVTGTCGTGLTYSFDTTTGQLTIAGNGAMYDYGAPESGNEAPWYSYSLQVKSVVINYGVTTIGSYAFYNFIECLSYSIPATVTSVGEWSFAHNAKLPQITLPNSVELVEAFAFYQCENLVTTKRSSFGSSTIILYPRKVAGDQSDVLSNNRWLVEGSNQTYVLDTSGGVNNYGTLKNAAGADVLNWYIDINSHTLVISSASPILANAMPDFDLSTKRAPWYMGGRYAFVTKIIIASNVSSIGDYAFAGMDRVTSVMMGHKITSIGKGAFEGVAYLPSLELPASVNVIKADAFKNCSALSTVKANCQSGAIAIDTTGNQKLLASISYLGGVSGGLTGLPIAGSNLTYTFDTVTKTLTISGAGIMPDYTSFSLTPWAGMATDIQAVVIEEGVSTVGRNAFQNCTVLRSVTLPTTVVLVGNGAFQNCSYLTSATHAGISTTIDSNNLPLSSVIRYLGGSVANTPSGNCGAAARWSFSTTTGVLSITGSGAMTDFTTTTAPWSQYMTQIRSVEVKGTVTSVGAYAFSGATVLTSVTLGSSVTSVGTNAFASCSSILTAYADMPSSQLTIQSGNLALTNKLTYKNVPSAPQGSTSGTIAGTSLTWSFDAGSNSLTITGNGAIPSYTSATQTPWALYKDRIQLVSVSTGVTGIGSYAFSSMPELVDVFIAGTVTEIGAYAFSGDTKLKTIELRSGVTKIGEAAFSGCKALETVVLPSTVTEIGANAFNQCAALKEITIPESITNIPAYAFANCESLETVVLPKSLLTIQERAFYGCKALRLLDLPEKLTFIGKEAFYNCSALKGVLLRSTGTLSIGESAFEGCSAIVKTIRLGNEPSVATGNSNLTNAYIQQYANGTSTDGTTWKVDRAAGVLTIQGTTAATSSDAWKGELKYVDTLVFDEGITAIGADLLRENKDIRYVRMSDTVTAIGDNAFKLCTALEEVTLSKNLETLGKGAFQNCSALTAIVLPDKLTAIPESAFRSCESLQTVTGGNNVKTIGADAFADCTALKSFDTATVLEAIGSGAFSRCTALEKIVLFGALKPLTSGIFNGCTALKEAHFNGTSTQWTTLTAAADTEIKNATPVYTITHTIMYVYGDMSQAHPSKIVTGTIGQVISEVSPVIPHYTPDVETVTVTFADKMAVTSLVTYTLNKYTVTIKPVDTNGNVIGNLITEVVAYGEGKEITLPTIAGYTPKTPTISLSEVTGDSTIEAVYDAHKLTVTVNCVDTSGNIFHTGTVEVAYNGTVTITPPTVNGYTPVSTDAKVFTSVTKDESCSFLYTPQQQTLTIHYVDEDGNKIADDYVKSHSYGEKISIASPEKNGYTPDTATYTKDAYDGTAEVTIVYRVREYVIKVHFVEAGTDNTHHVDYTITATVKHGQTYECEVAPIAGYQAMVNGFAVTNDKVSFVGVEKDMEVYVTYEPAAYTLTVRFVDVDGKLLSEKTIQVKAGEAYSVSYAPGNSAVAVGTMGTGNQTETVVVTNPDLGTTVTPDNNGAMQVVIVILIIILVLCACGVLFYFIYLKKRF